MEEIFTDLFRNIIDASPKPVKYIVITLLEDFIVWVFIMCGIRCSEFLWQIVCWVLAFLFFCTYIYLLIKIHKGKKLYESDSEIRTQNKFHDKASIKKDIIDKIVKKIRISHNINFINVEDENCIKLPFISDMNLEVWQMSENVIWVYFIYGNEELCISNEDFKSTNDFINAIIEEIDFFWNKKIKIVRERKPFHYYSKSSYYLDNQNNWKKYDESQNKFLFVFKETKTEEIYDFSIKE